MKNETTIALLIDCDNASHHAIEGVLNELAKYGVVNIRRAYGNWKSSHLRGWEEKLHPFAIVPIQQFCYTAGKNATDAAMIIDAMDLLYTNKPDAFALLTSDSDFTPLIMRLLTNGTRVFGFGEKKTPSPFVNACSQFIYTENLENRRDEPERSGQQRGRLSGDQLRSDTRLTNVLRTAAEQTTGDDGWSHLGRMAQYISNKTSFSPVNFGYKKVSDLIKATALFSVELRNNGNDMFVRPVDSGTDIRLVQRPDVDHIADENPKPAVHHVDKNRPSKPKHTVQTPLKPDPPISFRSGQKEASPAKYTEPEENEPIMVSESIKAPSDAQESSILKPAGSKKKPALKHNSTSVENKPTSDALASIEKASRPPRSLRELNLELKSGSTSKATSKLPKKPETQRSVQKKEILRPSKKKPLEEK